MLLLLLALGTALQSQAGAKPTPLNQGQWVLNTDYPAEAIKAREAGTVGVRLEVDAAGRVSSCSIKESAKSAALDAASCKLLMERARFEPARLAGKAVASIYDAKFKWVMPEDFDKLGEFLWTLDVDPDGRVARCVMEKSGQLPDMPNVDLCSTFSDAGESEFLTRHGPAYRTMRVILAVALNEAGYPLPVGKSDNLLARQVSELKVSEDSEKPISCILKATSGEDFGMNFCDEMAPFDARPDAREGKPVHTIRMEAAIYGTPR